MTRKYTRTDAPRGSTIPFPAAASSFLTFLLLLTINLGGQALAASLEDSLKTTESTNRSGADSQKRIDRLSNETRDLLEKYKRLIHNADYQESYNKELKQLKKEQEETLESLQQQVDDIHITQQRILPLMHGMAETLEQFILLDLPFHQEKRLSSVLVLKQKLQSASATIPDKFRSVWEAYQIENDYGRSIETYRTPLKLNGVELSVDILRIGRIGLYYQTLDGKGSGYWKDDEKKWASLPDEYNSSIKEGIRVAGSQLAPRLLNLPLLSMQ